MNPAAAVGAVTRAAGVPLLVDACQAVGQVDLDVGEIGCDMLSATGRKYLRGPRGTGFLYVSDSMVDRLVPSQPDHHGADLLAGDRFEWRPGARRFEHWEHNVAGWLGLGAAVDTAVRWGIDRIEATVTERAPSSCEHCWPPWVSPSTTREPTGVASSPARATSDRRRSCGACSPAAGSTRVAPTTNRHGGTSNGATSQCCCGHRCTTRPLLTNWRKPSTCSRDAIPDR